MYYKTERTRMARKESANWKKKKKKKGSVIGPPLAVLCSPSFHPLCLKHHPHLLRSHWDPRVGTRQNKSLKATIITSIVRRSHARALFAIIT